MESFFSVFLLPYTVLFLGTLATILIGLIKINTHKPVQVSTLLTLIGVMVTSTCTVHTQGVSFTPILMFSNAMSITGLSLIFTLLFSMLAFIGLLGSSRYLKQEELNYSEYYYLFLTTLLGAVLMILSNDLFGMFIGFEIMSLSAYCLAGFRRHDPRSNEAAIKYFLAGVIIAVFYLLGMTLIYAETGSVNFNELFEWSKSSQGGTLFFSTGQLFILTGLLIKVAAAPFHFWKPDTYEGSPAPSAGMLSTVVFAAAFVAFMKVLHIVDLTQEAWAQHVFYLKKYIRIISVMSMIVGAVVLISQKNLKRFFAYSSIVNTGYILLGVLASLSQPQLVSSVWVYLVGYTLTVMLAFVLMSTSTEKLDQKMELVDLTGLMRRRFSLMLIWSFVFFTMAGFPFTSGFIVKYSAFLSGIEAGEWMFVLVGTISVVITCYAYLRPIALMIMREADSSAGEWRQSALSYCAQLIAILALLCFGLFPAYALNVLNVIKIH